MRTIEITMGGTEIAILKGEPELVVEELNGTVEQLEEGTYTMEITDE